MLSAIPSTSSYNFQTPLVNTTTPGTNVTHVPYDNVAPSVSSAQVDNNTKGNSSPPPDVDDESPAANASGDADSGTLASIARSAQTNAVSSGMQATFITQLAAQDSTPETRGVLQQYAKQIANSNVKYMPSDALKPPVELSSVFSRILASENPAPPPVAQAPAAEAPQHSASEEEAIVTATPAVQAQPPRAIKQPANVSESAANASSVDGSAPILLPQIVHAYSSYSATASRIALLTPGPEAAQEVA